MPRIEKCRGTGLHRLQKSLAAAESEVNDENVDAKSLKERRSPFFYVDDNYGFLAILLRFQRGSGRSKS